MTHSNNECDLPSFLSVCHSCHGAGSTYSMETLSEGMLCLLGRAQRMLGISITPLKTHKLLAPQVLH